MKRAGLVFASVAVGVLGCTWTSTPNDGAGGGSGASGGSRATGGSGASGGATAAFLAAPAPGLCSRWVAVPLDLTAFPPPEHTASFAAVTDGRGGVTLTAISRDGGGTAVAFTPAGEPDGSPLTLGPGSPITDPADAGADAAVSDAAVSDAAVSDAAASDVDAGAPANVTRILATPTGWVAAFSDGYASELRDYDRGGAPRGTLLVARDALAVGVGTDGTIGVSTRDGSIGWFSPGSTTEDVAYTGLGSVASSVTWAGATAYAAGVSTPTMETLAPGGASFEFPSFDDGTYSRLVPAFDGQTVIGLDLGETGVEQPIGIAFASTAYPPRSYVLGEEILEVAGAYRAASGGAVLAFTSSGVTLWGGAPMALVEVDPGGARGGIVPLGSEVVAAAAVTIAGSIDGATYVAVAWTSSVHLAWIVRCAMDVEGQSPGAGR